MTFSRDLLDEALAARVKDPDGAVAAGHGDERVAARGPGRRERDDAARRPGQAHGRVHAARRGVDDAGEAVRAVRDADRDFQARGRVTDLRVFVILIFSCDFLNKLESQKNYLVTKKLVLLLSSSSLKFFFFFFFRAHAIEEAFRKDR